jgi:hypothetical protein
MTNLAPHLPATLLRDALGAACAIDHPYARMEALEGLAPHLPDRERPVLLAQALDSFPEPRQRASALTALASYLPATLLPDALDAARTILLYSVARAQFLIGLAPHLPAALLPDALDAARTIDDDPAARAQALIGLAPHLPDRERPTVLAEALDAARTIGLPDVRHQVFLELVQASCGSATLPWNPCWRVAFATAATHGRAIAAADLAATSVVIAQSGGVDAVLASSQALVDVARWWP